MKILQVVSSPPFAWATGGCARVAYDLSRELARLGHDIFLLTTDLHTPEKRYEGTEEPELPEGLEVIRFKNISNSLAWKIKFYFAPGLILYLRENLRDYEIVHLQDLLSLHAIFTSYYCRKYRVPYVLTTHGSLPWLKQKKVINRLYKLFFGNRIIKHASDVIVLNSTESGLCKEYNIPDSRIQIIPNGIDLRDYSAVPVKGNFKKQLSLQPEDKIVLYLGRLYEDKGVDLLIRAFKNLPTESSPVKLVFIGPDDGYRKTLDDMIRDLQLQDNTIFFGYADDLEKISALNDSYVLVIPRFTGFPVTFLEAGIMGLPIITTNGGDKLDWIDGQAGYVVEYDEKALTRALAEILSDEKKRRLFSDMEVQLIKREYLWEVLAGKIEDVYKKLLYQAC